LQQFTETRWSSALNMLSKAVKVRDAVERLYIVTGQEREYADQRVWLLRFKLSVTSRSMFRTGVIRNLGRGAFLTKLLNYLAQPRSLFLAWKERNMLPPHWFSWKWHVSWNLVRLWSRNVCDSYVFRFLSHSLDDAKDNEALHKICDDLLEELETIWANLPVDSVICSMLDPRTKWFEKIPARERNEALKEMQKVFRIFVFIRLTLRNFQRITKRTKYRIIMILLLRMRILYLSLSSKTWNRLMRENLLLYRHGSKKLLLIKYSREPLQKKTLFIGGKNTNHNYLDWVLIIIYWLLT
jgi:hypothetical protein